MKHELKCWPEHFQAVRSGHKTVELRKDDRLFASGDALHLREYDPIKQAEAYEALSVQATDEDEEAALWEQACLLAYTGQEEHVRVTHVLRGGEWLSPGYVALSIRLMGEDGRERVQTDFKLAFDAERAAHDDTTRALLRLKDEKEQWKAKYDGVNLAADQYSESRDQWMLKAKVAERDLGIVEAERDTLSRQIDHYLAERDISDMMHDAEKQERDEARAALAAAHERIAAADDALAGMVIQYMQFPEGYISHEFMGAQEDAIEYLENIGWLKAGELERYYWTPESPEGKYRARVSSAESAPTPAPMEETQVRIAELESEINQAREILSALDDETLIQAATDLVREYETTNEAYHNIHARYWKEAMPRIKELEGLCRTLLASAQGYTTDLAYVDARLLAALARAVGGE